VLVAGIKRQFGCGFHRLRGWERGTVIVPRL
jgi:hypothetical protein